LRGKCGDGVNARGTQEVESGGTRGGRGGEQRKSTEREVIRRYRV